MLFGRIIIEPLKKLKHLEIFRDALILNAKNLIESETIHDKLSITSITNIKSQVFKHDLIHDIHKKNTLVYCCGNIYNRESLISEFCINDQISNPELILILYSLLGPDFANRLNGDFVIIIYLTNEETLFLYRDHLGIMPLAYALVNDTLFFSTDIVGLCRNLQRNEKLNIEPFAAWFRFADLCETYNKNVKKLLPGHYLKCSNKEIELIKYWEPEKIRTNNKLNRKQVYSELKRLVVDAVHIRSSNLYKAAAHVSGGLDSSIIAALARKEYKHQKNFYGYSWSPQNFTPGNVEFDERKLVLDTCSMNHIDPVFVTLTPEDSIIRSKNYVRNLGAFAEEKVLEHANKQDVNLLFSGWGGDEFISKGERGINSDLLFNLNLGLYFNRNSLRNPKKFVRTLLYEVILPAMHVVNPGAQRAHKGWTHYLKQPFKKNHFPSIRKFLFYKSRRELHLGFLYHYHISGRTETAYVHGFLHGVEYRYPLLDKRIIEYMLQVPTKHLIRGKYSRMILREMGIGLVPEEVRWIRKGSDPVYTAQNRQNNTNVALALMKEIEVFRANPDLFFFDFDLLIEDFEKNRNDQQFPDNLIDNINSIKMLHEFTKSYRNNDFLNFCPKSLFDE